MRISIRGKVLLVGACMMAGLAAWGQQASSTAAKKGINFDLAVNYTAEKAEQSPNYCGCFWLQGGSTDLSTILWKGLGVAVAFNGDTASAINTGVDLTKIEGMAGPRYTTRVGHVGGSKHPVSVFGEGLAGRVWAFNSNFATKYGTVVSDKTAIAFEAGGGINVRVNRYLAVRAIQVDFVRNYLPNTGGDVQNNARVSFGAIYHFGK
jgi:hypothetical protein